MAKFPDAIDESRTMPVRGADRLLTTRDAAARLGVHERTIRRAIVRGDIPALKQDGVYRISAAAIDRIAAARGAAPLVLLPSPAEMTPLPAPLTSFIGRAAERAAVAARLQDEETRLLTLTGPGGIGKSRLAIAAAGDAAAEFAEGVVFVSLAAIARADLVLPAIAEALGLKESARHDLQQRILAFLRPRRLLLVLDNVEHLLTAAPLIADLLMHAAGLTMLVTSRTPLRIQGEREFMVPALSLPMAGRPISAESLLTSEAARLFVERAQRVDDGFALDGHVAAAVAAICGRLDGLPLAIELAAARLKTLSPSQLQDRLERRLPLLTGGPRDAPARQRTLRNAIAWSYDLLIPAEQRLFCQLAVFVDGCTLEAAEAIGGDGAVLDRLDALVDQSLLLREHGLDGELRFRMLETIREYGLERLEARGEASAARAAHAAYFLALAETLRPLTNTRSIHGPLDRLSANDANLRAALAWLEQHGPAADFVTMVTACYTFLCALSHFHDAEAWIVRAHAVQDEATPAVRARLVVGLGELHLVQGHFAQAATVLAEGVAHMRELDDPIDLAMALISQGASFNYGGDFTAAETTLQEALGLASAIAEPTLHAAVAGRALANLSVAARGRGELRLAAARGETALACFHVQGLALAEVRTLLDLGDIAGDQGDYHRAVERYQDCLNLADERSELRLVADAIVGIAGAAAVWGQHREALLLFGAAAAFRERTRFGMVLPADAATIERHMQTLRASVDDQTINAIFAEGHALSLSEAHCIAATVTAVGEPAVMPSSTTVLLTEREREVLRLLVARRTDREIAAALFLSRRTVEWHVASILSKLGARSRREAAEMAVAAGLL